MSIEQRLRPGNIRSKLRDSMAYKWINTAWNGTKIDYNADISDKNKAVKSDWIKATWLVGKLEELGLVCEG